MSRWLQCGFGGNDLGDCSGRRDGSSVTGASRRRYRRPRQSRYRRKTQPWKRTGLLTGSHALALRVNKRRTGTFPEGDRKKLVFLPKLANRRGPDRRRSGPHPCAAFLHITAHYQRGRSNSGGIPIRCLFTSKTRPAMFELGRLRQICRLLHLEHFSS